MSVGPPENLTENSEVIFSDYSASAIEELMNDIVYEHVSGLPESEAKKLFLDLDDILDNEDSEEVLLERTKALSHDQKAQYAKFLTIKNSLKAASHIIAVGNAGSDSAQNEYEIDHMVGQMKEKGVSAEQLGSVLSSITQWRTGTPHPTQHLSEEGKQLFRDVLSIVSLPKGERHDSLKNTITSMFDAQITRSAKMDVREETNSDREQAKLRRQGMRETYIGLKSALQNHYGEDAPNLLSGSILLELAYHSWFGGGDTDGKSNADKWALLEGLTGYTMDAIEEHLEDINKAIEIDSSLSKRLESTKNALEIVRERLTALDEKLLNRDETTDSEALKREYANLYKGLEIGHTASSSVNTEKDAYLALSNELKHVVDHLAKGEAKELLEGSLFVLRQYKNAITTARIETRANGFVDQDIVNQIFGDKEFQKTFLTGEMRRSLASRTLASLPKEEQRAIMQAAEDKCKNNVRLFAEHYYRIFPEGLDDKGFPNQKRERGERLEIQAITPDKFGMSIVADAQPMSPEYARFLGEVGFGVKHMMHTMLTEDYDTLDAAADITIDFTKNGGMKSVFSAINSNPRLGEYLDRHGVMLPCSDSTKKLGPAAVYFQAQAINHLMDYAVEENKTMYIKWGNGQIITRGGGNSHVPGRLKAQAMQWHLDGRKLDLNVPEDIKLLANVMFSSNTEQGRAADFVSPTSQKIASNQLTMIGEMFGRVLELSGKAPIGTHIKQVPEYTSGVRKHVIDSIARNIMMLGYLNFRDVVDEEGNRLSDEVAIKSSNMKVAGDANQAARPDSKVVDAPDPNEPVAIKDGKPLYDLRAIGTTISINHMRTYHDGWFSLGAGLQAMHQANIEGEISDEDLAKFPKDPLWESIIKNGLRTATMSDMSHVMKKLDAGDWSHEKAMRIGKSVEVDLSGDANDPPLFSFDGAEDGVTAQQAYAAKLYYDQALFITYAEKLAQLHLEGEPLPETLEEIEQASVLHCEGKVVGGHVGVGHFATGEFTRKLYPLVDQDLNGNRKAALPSQVLSDVAEECHSELSKTERFAITAAQRATSTWNNADLYLDQDAYGSKPYPAIEEANLAHLASLSSQSDKKLEGGIENTLD